MAKPDAAYASRGDEHTAFTQLVVGANLAMGGVVDGMLNHRRFGGLIGTVVQIRMVAIPPQ